MHRWFLSSLLALAVIATSTTAAFARDIPREPQDYAADMARWHFIHQRDRKALQSIAKQFPSIRAALATGAPELTTSSKRLERANQESSWLAPAALGTTLGAILYSNGKYAVTKNARKQRESRRQQTLAMAEGMIAHLRANHSGDFAEEVWGTFCRHVERRATLALDKGDYNDVVRDLLRAHPMLGELVASRDAASFGVQFQGLSERVQQVVPHLLAAVLRSNGAVKLGRNSDAKERVAWAVAAVYKGQFDSVDLKADALAAQPAVRSEYVRFVLETAADDRFSSAWGWQHVQRVASQMHKQATESVKDHKRWEAEEKPSRTHPENSCQ